MGCLVNEDILIADVVKMISIYLECVAMLPQFHFVHKAKRIHRLILLYIMILGFSRGIHVADWLYAFRDRYYYHNYYHYYFVTASEIVQFILYCDFFIYTLPNVKIAKTDEEYQEQYLPTTLTPRGLQNDESVNTNHLQHCVSTIVLTPASLIIDTNDKVIGNPLYTFFIKTVIHRKYSFSLFLYS